jgi:hypothetical protein
MIRVLSLMFQLRTGATKKLSASTNSRNELLSRYSKLIR